MADKLPSDKIQKNLKTIVDHFDEEDRSAREWQLRSWRRNKLLWEGFTRIWYSEVAHDWRIWDDDVINSSDTDQSYYDKPINVFRAYLESVIAALSITVPPTKCYPDDADNPLDMETAKAGDKISQLIYRHNDVPLLWLHALYIYCTEGMLACYSYPKESEEYGSYEVDVYKDVEEEAYVCPVCKVNIPDEVLSARQEDKFMPDEDDVDLDNELQLGPVCPQCAELLDPNLQKSKLIVTRLVGHTTKPKSRICMEAYGGLYVKVPNYAMMQRDIPYLQFSYETHYTNAIDRYEHLTDTHTKSPKIGPSAGGTYDPYEQWARLSPQYKGDYPTNNVTVRNTWLRPSSYNILNSPADIAELKKEYPNGVKVVMVSDQFAEACPECLDDCWTILYDPLSDYLHKQPPAAALAPIQDITSDIISLVLQTLEHGISQTFADPQVLNFEAYRQSEASPGSVYPASAKTGKAVSDGFFETRTATLSEFVLPFFQAIQGLGQTVSGAQPSLFGGQLEGSRTASEYSMSRAQALQRLQNTWKMLTVWWKNIFSKVIPIYINEVRRQGEERHVERDELGNFINVFVRKAELEGKIGRIELEANENLPITWSQRKDTYLKLMEIQNPQLQMALQSPENIKNLAEAIGLDDFIIPGEADRQKQYEEIQVLINTEPIFEPPNEMQVMEAAINGQEPEMQELPSIEVDPDLDNHDVEAEICRTYLVSSAGRLLKVENPTGYKNVLLHYKQHMMIIKQGMMEQQAAAEEQQGKSKGSNTPLAENENVAAES